MRIYQLLESQPDRSRYHMLHMQQLLIDRDVDCEAKIDLWPYEGTPCLLIVELMSVIELRKKLGNNALIRAPRVIAFKNGTTIVYDRADRELTRVNAELKGELERIANKISARYKQLYAGKV